MYVDVDGDGFGVVISVIFICLEMLLDGFVFNNFDCDDSFLEVNLDVEEIFCNGIDENCNVVIIDDDLILLVFVMISDIVCLGVMFIISVVVDFEFQVFWYIEVDCFSGIIWVGNDFQFLFFVNIMVFLQEYYYYVEVINFVCIMLVFGEVIIMVLFELEGMVIGMLEVCFGESFDFVLINIVDNCFIGVSLSFYMVSLVLLVNELLNIEVMIENDFSFVYFLMSFDVCIYESIVIVSLKELLQISFMFVDFFLLCCGLCDMFVVQVIGGQVFYIYIWQSGCNVVDFFVQVVNQVGILMVYLFMVIDVDGCIVIDFVLI